MMKGFPTLTQLNRKFPYSVPMISHKSNSFIYFSSFTKDGKNFFNLALWL